MPRRKITRRSRYRVRGAKGVRRVAAATARRVVASATENKVHDVDGTFQPEALTVPVFLTQVQAGDTSRTRDGREITPRSLQVRMHLKANFSVNGMTPVRVTFVRVRLQTDSSEASAMDDLVYDSASIATGDTILAPYNRDTRVNYEVLLDRRYVLSPAEGGHNLFFRFGRKQLRRIMYADDTATTVTGTNHVIMFVRSDQTGTAPSMSYWSRMLYKDA